MINKLANHERRYIRNRKNGARCFYASPLEVYAWDTEIGNDKFSILSGKDVSLRKNGSYVPLSFTLSEKQLFKK